MQAGEDNFEIQTEVGKFVVDSWNASVVVKVNQEKDSLGTFFSYSLSYHFENVPGTLFTSTFCVGDECLIINVTPASPTPVNVQRTWSNGWWVRNNLEEVDSVMMVCRMQGAFWIYTDGGPRTLGTFEWVQNEMIPVERELGVCLNHEKK